MRQRQFVVKSDRDDGIVFDARSVAWEARIRGVTPLRAARELADENGDSVMGETLYAQEA